MNIRDDIIEINNFFSEEELCRFESAIEKFSPGRTDTATNGPFAGQVIANYVFVHQDLEIKDYVNQRIKSVLGNLAEVESFVRVKLFLPWDIHADWFPNLSTPGYQPYYNMLIPLENIKSRTIIFNQEISGDGERHFQAYKQTHNKLEHPIDINFWNDNLSMCWPEDREYVSLKYAMVPQQRGQLLGFPSRFFHSSDNFHQKTGLSKTFIHMRVDRLK